MFYTPLNSLFENPVTSQYTNTVLFSSILGLYGQDVYVEKNLLAIRPLAISMKERINFTWV